MLKVKWVYRYCFLRFLFSLSFFLIFNNNNNNNNNNDTYSTTYSTIYRAYALVLSGNHVFTSGAQGTNAAAVRGALRANQTDLLTVVLPQSMAKQTSESQELLSKVENVIAFPERDELSLEMASKLCNSFMLNQTDQLISFAFHESSTVIEAADEAKEVGKLVTMLFLD